MTRELERFRAEHPRSLELAEEARAHAARRRADALDDALAGRLPGLRGASAEGARFTDVDGHEYVDFCLGDTGAMTGHAPAADAARDRRAGAARASR